MLNGDFWQVKNLADSFGLVAEFTYKLCKKHNLNIVLAGKSGKGEKSAPSFCPGSDRAYETARTHACTKRNDYEVYGNWWHAP